MVVHWPPPCMASVSRWYRCIGLQNPCWQQIITQSQHENAECKEEFHVWTFQTQGWPWERSYLVAVFFEKVSGSFQRRKSSLVRKFTLQKKRELFKYKDFILAVRSHNRVRSLDLSVAEPNHIIFLPPKSSLCRENTQCLFPKTMFLASMKSMEGHLTWALFNVILYLRCWRDFLWERFVS